MALKDMGIHIRPGSILDTPQTDIDAFNAQMRLALKEWVQNARCSVCSDLVPMWDMSTCACGARVCVQAGEYVFKCQQLRNTPTLEQWREWKARAEDVIRERDRYAARIKKLEAERDALREILK